MRPSAKPKDVSELVDQTLMILGIAVAVVWQTAVLREVRFALVAVEDACVRALQAVRCTGLAGVRNLVVVLAVGARGHVSADRDLSHVDLACWTAQAGRRGVGAGEASRAARRAGVSGDPVGAWRARLAGDCGGVRGVSDEMRVAHRAAGRAAAV